MPLRLLLLVIVTWGFAMYLPKLAVRDLSAAGVVVANALGYLICMPLVIHALTPADKHFGRGHAYGALAGVLFLVGNVAFYKLVHSNQVAVVVPFTAVYVAIPVLMGAVCLREQLSRAQWCGVVLALVACCLLSVKRTDRIGPTEVSGPASVAPP